MDIAAIRDSPTLDLLALKAKLIVLDVKDVFIPRGVNKQRLNAELEYTNAYASLERVAQQLDDYMSAIEYGTQKREHLAEADRLVAALYKK